MRLLLPLLAVISTSVQDESATRRPLHDGEGSSIHRGQGGFKQPHRERQFQIQGVDVFEDRRKALVSRTKRQYGQVQPAYVYEEPAASSVVYQQQPPPQPQPQPRRPPPPPPSPPKQLLPPSPAPQPVRETRPRIAGVKTAVRYYYPPRQRFPLPKCFYNPTGYVCCNEELNDLMVKTYSELESKPRFHTCNVQALANTLQKRLENRFNETFETIAAYDDFAQKVHFRGDLVCKVELGGRFMLAYVAARDLQEDQLPPLSTHRPITEEQFNLNRGRTLRI
ncbi:ground-like domain protein [Ancylostoma caninum]|uniref:Ground-like domain protein n=1 Tax=Ancylostoma caninum TaxID=29170 RepID=A0A368H302_ANCCA|nr:ground-like domain protein [Ancylostoma caninum]